MSSMIVRLAWRSIWRSRRRTAITVCSIGMGLTFAIFFISLGEGMYAQMVDQAVRMQAGYITVQHPEYREAPAIDLWVHIPEGLRKGIEQWPQVEETKMLILGQGIAKSGAGSMAAAIMGVEPAVEVSSSPLARNIVEGNYIDEHDNPMVVVGIEMAERLGLKTGKKMVIATNDVNGVLVEQLCRVKGIFKTGSEEMDAYVIQMPIDFARRLFHMPEESATQMGVILYDPDTQNRVLRRLREKMGPVRADVLPWQEVLPDVASYIRMDKGSNFVFQGILIFLILFTIFNTILMSVLERKREFAMLLALGTQPAKLRLQVLAESAFLGLIGCLLGMLLGSLATTLVNVYGIDMSALMGESVNISGFAMTSKLHTKLSAWIILKMTGIVFTATVLLSLIPMRHATKLSVVDSLRQA
jgi:putative ABC transport system permease protein